MDAKLTKVSFVPAENETAPDAFVVPTNCFLIVICESLAPELVSVNNVLIICLGILTIA